MDDNQCLVSSDSSGNSSWSPNNDCSSTNHDASSHAHNPVSSHSDCASSLPHAPSKESDHHKAFDSPPPTYEDALRGAPSAPPYTNQFEFNPVIPVQPIDTFPQVPLSSRHHDPSRPYPSVILVSQPAQQPGPAKRCCVIIMRMLIGIFVLSVVGFILSGIISAFQAHQEFEEHRRNVEKQFGDFDFDHHFFDD